MVLILLDSCKQNISYDRANLKKVSDFYALTWLIFAGPVTYTAGSGSKDSPSGNAIPLITILPQLYN